jgi:hypothetical protein
MLFYDCVLFIKLIRNIARPGSFKGIVPGTKRESRPNRNFGGFIFVDSLF